MSDDLFGGSSGLGNVSPMGIVHRVSQSEVQRERCITAYRNNIALPDVYIADRRKAYTPLVVGEDGQEITPERRAELMRAAGVKPMFDENGERTGEVYTDRFADVIESEPLGATAVANREPIRIVQPVELDTADLVGMQIDESTISSAEGDLYVPGTEVVMSNKRSCVYTSGCQDMADPEQMRKEIREAIQAFYISSGSTKKGPAKCVLSHDGYKVVEHLMGLESSGLLTCTSFLGIPIVINDSLRNEIRFYGDEAFEATCGKYASVFLCRKLYEQFRFQHVDPHCDTTEVDIGVDDAPIVDPTDNEDSHGKLG